ncbi:MAG: pyridoxal phosphate-dependent aminotransferase [Alphaproteobacteria bacterium]
MTVRRADPSLIPTYAAPVRQAAAQLPASKIGEVAVTGRGDPDVIPLWFGEGDLVTPAFINDAAKQALDAGETFYTWQRGIPELRRAIAGYTERVYGIACGSERITVTGSGMQAILLTCQALIGRGDNAVIVGPIWPNVVSSVEIQEGEPRMVDLAFADGRWSLDLDRLFAAVDERTRLIFVNSPSNPTGWTMTSDEQKALLDFCRARRIWLLADEVYARIVYDRPAAPSFLEHAGPDDPLVVVQSFSKPWAMTGWRLGWITSPDSFGELIAKLTQFNTSGSPAFLQKGALAAIEQGEPFLAQMVERCRVGREVVLQGLSRYPRVRIARPEAAFYAFFGVDGMTDSLDFAKRLVRESKVGVAPGIAFGEGGEGYLRLCFASAPERLQKAMDRMGPLLS